MTKAPDITKLPQWAQAHIQKLERERNTAIEAMNQALDSQTPGPISTSEYLSTGEAAGPGPSLKTRYFHANQLEIDHKGVKLAITLREDGPSSQNDIYLSWSASDGRMNNVAFVPLSFQQAALIAKKHMR